jgi:putative ABC transport system permease protein
VLAFRNAALKTVGADSASDIRDAARKSARRSSGRAFLGLSALLTVILAAWRSALSARRYLQRHLDACAIMRCLARAGRPRAARPASCSSA